MKDSWDDTDAQALEMLQGGGSDEPTTEPEPESVETEHATEPDLDQEETPEPEPEEGAQSEAADVKQQAASPDGTTGDTDGSSSENASAGTKGGGNPEGTDTAKTDDAGDGDDSSGDDGKSFGPVSYKRFKGMVDDKNKYKARAEEYETKYTSVVDQANSVIVQKDAEIQSLQRQLLQMQGMVVLGQRRGQVQPSGATSQDEGSDVDFSKLSDEELQAIIDGEDVPTQQEQAPAQQEAAQPQYLTPEQFQQMWTENLQKERARNRQHQEMVQQIRQDHAAALSRYVDPKTNAPPPGMEKYLWDAAQDAADKNQAFDFNEAAELFYTQMDPIRRAWTGPVEEENARLKAELEKFRAGQQAPPTQAATAPTRRSPAPGPVWPDGRANGNGEPPQQKKAGSWDDTDAEALALLRSRFG